MVHLLKFLVIPWIHYLPHKSRAMAESYIIFCRYLVELSILDHFTSSLLKWKRSIEPFTWGFSENLLWASWIRRHVPYCLMSDDVELLPQICLFSALFMKKHNKLSIDKFHILYALVQSFSGVWYMHSLITACGPFECF